MTAKRSVEASGGFALFIAHAGRFPLTPNDRDPCRSDQ